MFMSTIGRASTVLKVVLDLHNLLPFCKDGWLTAQGFNGTLAELAKPLDPAIQILSAEVGYLICSKFDGSDKRPIQDHDILFGNLMYLLNITRAAFPRYSY